MTSYFDTIIEAATAAKAQYSVLGKQSDNAEVLKEMSVDIFKAVAGLVHRAGGDNDYLEPWVDGVPNDIDLCFKAVQPDNFVGDMFRLRRGLGLDISSEGRL